MSIDTKTLLIPSPSNNSGRAFNSGVEDAAAGRPFRKPVESLYGAYCEGWLKIKPLPEGECWTG